MNKFNDEAAFFIQLASKHAAVVADALAHLTTTKTTYQIEQMRDSGRMAYRYASAAMSEMESA